MTAMGYILCALMSCCATLDDIQTVALTVKFPNSNCSGTAVAEDVILTAAHCQEKGETVSFVNNLPVVTIASESDGKDHLLIRVSGIKFKQWATLGKEPKASDKIRWIGNPVGMERMYREGYMIGKHDETIYLDGRGFRGDSGAGVFNDQGQLVGTLTGIAYWHGPSGTLLQLPYILPFAFTQEQWDSFNVKAP